MNYLHGFEDMIFAWIIFALVCLIAWGMSTVKNRR